MIVAFQCLHEAANMHRFLSQNGFEIPRLVRLARSKGCKLCIHWPGKFIEVFKHLTQAAWILSISFQFLLRVPTSHALFRSFWLILNANLYNPPAVHIACPPNTVIFSPHFSLTHLHYAVGVWQGQWIKARQTFPWADTTPKKWAGQVFISPPKD